MAAREVLAKSLRVHIRTLCGEERYDPGDGRWTFRSGGDCCRCTDSALKIAEHFGGKVFGYYCRQNPIAQINCELCGEGHDFALVAEDFLVDYWAYRIAGITKSPVLNLRRKRDRGIVLQLYGDESKWQEVVLNPNEKEP